MFRARGFQIAVANLFIVVVAAAAAVGAPLKRVGGAEVTVACGDVDGLVQAIHDANDRRPDPTTITLGPSTPGDPCRYEFLVAAHNDFWGPTALPPIQAPVTLRSADQHENTELDGTGRMRLFLVHNKLTLDSITVMNGRADSNLGGGIINEGQLTLDGSATVVQNSSTFDGGGIFNLSTVIMNDTSAVIGNQAVLGGGIFSCGTVVLNDDSVVIDNMPDDCNGC